jgi:hypothetical protein
MKLGIDQIGKQYTKKDFGKEYPENLKSTFLIQSEW